MNLKSIFTGAALSLALLSSAQQPKYIFYYIGDGMGVAPVNAAEYYNRMVLNNERPLTMLQFPTVGWCQTYSASHPITDSAAAGTALATGHKTKNSMLGMNPDTVAVNSIAAELQQMGYGIGIATSVAPDDATPGAFYAHVSNRSQFYNIDKQMATSGYQFFAGAGLRGTKTDGQPNDVMDTFAQNGVQIVYGPEGVKEINSDKVLLLNVPGFEDNNISYTVDSIQGMLTLPVITEACLAQLERTSPDKFFMMIEGGNIDHALHGNDGGAAIKEIINFDQALEMAYNFYLAHPDETLIVVTADHDTGGSALVNKRGANLANVDFQRVSKEQFSEYCKSLLRSRNIYTWDDMKEYLADNLGFFTHIKLSDKQEAGLKEMFDRTFELRNTDDQKTLYANFNAFAVEVFSIFNDAIGMAFTTTSHSANPTPVFAVGVGAEQFRGFNNNIDLPRRILSIAKGETCCGNCCK
ncbi:MAG: alkaline phosphatase [Bacteroidales bacterium]|nr:alkaline phosphatase [Bacteroidales bacterium]